MEFLANNMEDLRNKMAFSDFETLKSSEEYFFNREEVSFSVKFTSLLWFLGFLDLSFLKKLTGWTLESSASEE